MHIMSDGGAMGLLEPASDLRIDLPLGVPVEELLGRPGRLGATGRAGLGRRSGALLLPHVLTVGAARRLPEDLRPLPAVSGVHQRDPMAAAVTIRDLPE